MSEVTDLAEKRKWDLMADQLLTMEQDLNSLRFSRVLFTFNRYTEFLAFLVICADETVELCIV